MLGGVASLPPSLPSLQNIGILHHKKAKLRIHMRQSVLQALYYKTGTLDRELGVLGLRQKNNSQLHTIAEYLGATL